MLGNLSKVVGALGIILALFIGLTLVALVMHWIIFIAPAAILVLFLWILFQDTEDPPPE